MGQKVENRDNQSFDMSDFFWNNQLPFEAAIAMGKVTGISGGNKFGQVPLFDPSDGRIPVWEEAVDYPYQTSAFTPSVASDDATDTIAGVGAQKVVIEGNDENGDMQSEEIELDGQTPVASLLSWSRIYRMYTEQVGSSGTAVGSIRCGIGAFALGVPATTLGRINNGNNQSQMCIFTVPRGHTCVITSITYTTISGKPVIYHDEARLNTSVFDTTKPFRNTRTINVEQNYSLELGPGGAFPEFTDLQITALATQPVSTCECAFRYILIPNDWFERRT